VQPQFFGIYLTTVCIDVFYIDVIGARGAEGASCGRKVWLLPASE
jgi:hypothetical protein